MAKKSLAIFFCSALAFEEMDRYWAGLPTVLLGSPLPPSTGGKVMWPSPPPETKSPPSVCWMPYDQAPCSIIAALPVYSSAWSALESAVIEEKPLMNPSASTSSCALVSALMASGWDQASFSPSMTAWKTSEPPMRSNRNSSHIMLVHRD